MLDGQDCLLPVRHFHREDTTLSSWSGIYTTCRVEASAATTSSPNPSPDSPHNPALVGCPWSAFAELESARGSHSELVNPRCDKSFHCSPVSHLEAETLHAWDYYGELAGKVTMPCTSSGLDCSSTSPGRSAQTFSFFPDQDPKTDPAQTWSTHGQLEERPCFFSKGDRRSTQLSRSSAADVELNKFASKEESFLESAGGVSNSSGEEELSLTRFEHGEDSNDKAMKIGVWLNRDDAEAVKSEENQMDAEAIGREANQMGAVHNPGTSEDHRRYPERKKLCLRSEESKVKDSKEIHGDSPSVQDNTVLSGSASTPCSRIVDGNGKRCKRLRIANRDDISCAAFAESVAILATGPAGKVACNSPVNGLQQPYLPDLDDESALRCLAFVPLFDLGRLAMVGKRYRDLVKSQDFFKLRRTYGMVENLVFIYSSGTDVWTAYDANRNVWRTLPPADVNNSFENSDKESLSAGTHVLWLGKHLYEFVYYRYDLVTNSWETGTSMVNPRCLFASATCGEFAFIAGGFGSADNNGGFRLLNSAEKYSSLTGTWELLPPMSIPRFKCSGFFMDNKFYVIGGKDVNHEPIMSGEEYNPATRVWRTIPNMYFTPEVARRDMCESSPPLVAVVNNELYAVENTTNVLKMYNKHSNTWRNLGPLPVRAHLCNGWGVAFKALGDQLFVMGDADGIAFAFCWQPGPNATEPVWQRLYHRERGTGFLYNCAVMTC